LRLFWFLVFGFWFLGFLGAWLGLCGGAQIERRPRGASRAALDLKGAEDPKASASRLKPQGIRPQKNIAQPPCNPLVTPQ